MTPGIWLQLWPLAATAMLKKRSFQQSSRSRCGLEAINLDMILHFQPIEVHALPG